jgi:hypothetical protein
MAEGRVAALMLPPDAGLEALPRVELDDQRLAVLTRGQSVRHGGDGPGPESGALLRVVDASGRLAAMARLDSGRLVPEKVFVAGGR